eukprot:TRINITY_DN12421_c1_g6_i4.p1 TRINITY_DN12421_c1_g6~~TRINITY_DN12421_c1_g6_i4.p1  ORF type:complete len:775 (+),score=102.98 TRINITY_DN12421_c1_g6_i4:321-2645(+)
MSGQHLPTAGSRKQWRERLFHAVEHNDMSKASMALACGAVFDQGLEYWFWCNWTSRSFEMRRLVLVNIARSKLDGFKQKCLHAAAIMEDHPQALRETRKLLAANTKAFTDATSSDDWTSPLHLACVVNNPGVVELLLDAGADIDATDQAGLSPINAALLCHAEAAVELLIKRGADFSKQNELEGLDDQVSPLHLACIADHPRFVSMLINAGACVNAQTRRQRSPLHAACKYSCSTTIVRSLVDAGADVTAKCSKDKTPLHYLSKSGGPVEMAELLLAAGANIDAKDEFGKRPLDLACERHPSLAKLFISKGADVHAPGKGDKTPLHLTSSVEVAKLLVQAGAEIEPAKGRGCTTPLHTAKSVEVAEFFLSLGADMEAKDWNEATPLLRACRESPAVAKMLINKGADVHATDKDGETTLMHACEGRHNLELVDMLIQRGVDINAIDKGGRIALSVAVGRESMDTVKLLLKAGADVNTGKPDETPALEEAALNGNSALLELLLAAGAVPNADKPGKSTAMHTAARSGPLRAVELLVEAGADVTAQDHDGRTPLHCLAQGCAFNGTQAAIASLLIAAGADAMAQNKNGDTPLHISCERHSLIRQSVKALLLKAGADPHCLNKKGESPLSLMVARARANTGRYGHDGIVSLSKELFGYDGPCLGSSDLCKMKYWPEACEFILERDAEPIRLMYLDGHRDREWQPTHLEQLKRRKWTTDDVWRSEYRHLLPYGIMEASVQPPVLHACTDDGAIPIRDQALGCIVKWCYIAAWKTMKRTF